jgi:hypothetical protein
VAGEERAVVIDEFSSDFETVFGGDSDRSLPKAINRWVERESLYDSYGDLIDGRNEPLSESGSEDERKRIDLGDLDRRRTTLRLIETLPAENRGRSPEHALRATGSGSGGSGPHALAPLVAYTILADSSRGKTEVNGVERVPLSHLTGSAGSVGLFDHRGRLSSAGEPGIYLLDPPSIESDTIIGVDGTPHPGMWNVAMGLDMDYQQVLSDAERCRYIGSDDGLGITLVGCTDAVRSYNNPEWIESDTENVRTIVDHINNEHDEKPGLVTSKAAIDVYGENYPGLLDAFDLRTPGSDHRRHSIYYGNVLGSNKYENKMVGFVSGHCLDERPAIGKLQ